LAIDISAEILGAKEIQDMLAELKDRQANLVMARALKDGAQVYQAAIAEAAPERLDDEPSGTALPPGALKSDVIVRSTKSDGGPAYMVTFGKLTKHVAAWAEYGHRVIHGGRSRLNKKTGKAKGKGTDTGKITKASGFFRRTYEELTPEVTQVIMKSLNEGLSKAFKGKK
jgi:bacteriophage HK97-gp10 putative tail-component